MVIFADLNTNSTFLLYENNDFSTVTNKKTSTEDNEVQLNWILKSSSQRAHHVKGRIPSDGLFKRGVNSEITHFEKINSEFDGT